MLRHRTMPSVINCLADDAAGRIALPAQLLAEAPSGASIITNVFRSATTLATTDDAAVYLEARSLVTWTGTFQ